MNSCPKSKPKQDRLEGRRSWGIFLGYHVQSGGLWNGDYIVADYEPFKNDCDALESKVNIHRIKDVLKNLTP